VSECKTKLLSGSYELVSDSITVLSLGNWDGELPSSGLLWSEYWWFLWFLTFEDGTDRLSRNVGKELALLAE